MLQREAASNLSMADAGETSTDSSLKNNAKAHAVEITLPDPGKWDELLILHTSSAGR